MIALRLVVDTNIVVLLGHPPFSPFSFPWFLGKCASMPPCTPLLLRAHTSTLEHREHRKELKTL